MYVSTRCNFANFSLTWLSVNDFEEYCSLERYPKLPKEIIKELNIEKGVEWSMSAFLLEAEGKKALFDTGYNITISSGITDRLKELRISPDEIDYIFITHFHWDHIDGLIDGNDNIFIKMPKFMFQKKNMMDG